MAKTANIMVRVEPDVKERAEQVLENLGISLSTAMNMYLKQIDLQKRIPFEIAMPTSYDSLSDDAFDLLMQEAYDSAEQGRVMSLNEFKQKVEKEFN